MSIKRALLVGWLCASACDSPPVQTADAEVVDAGIAKFDAGNVAVDSGVAPFDAGLFVEAYGPCNDGLWAVSGPFLDGGSPNVTVLGLLDPNERRELRGGERIDGRVYLINGAQLVITPGDGGFATIAADLTLLGHSRLIADGGKLRVPQTASTSFVLYAGDEASVVLSRTALVLGSTDNNLWTMAMCGRSSLELRGLDLLREKKSTPTPFAFDSAKVQIIDPNDFVELSISAHAQGVIREARSATVGAYLIVTDAVPHELQLTSGFVDGGQLNTLRTEDGGIGARLEVVNSNTLYGLWVHPHTDLTLRDSSLALFLRFDQSTTIEGLVGDFMPRTKRFAFGDRSMRLINSSVYPINAYYEPAQPGTLQFTGSTIGEITCNGPVGTRCSLDGGGIDGTGGFATVIGSATLDMANADLNTYLLTRDDAVARLRQVAHRPNSQLPPSFRRPLSIQAVGRSLVVLENQNPFVSRLEDGGVIPQVVADEAAVVDAAMYLDPNSAADTDFSGAVTRSVVGAAAVVTDGGTHRLLRSRLSATRGATTVSFSENLTSLAPLSEIGVLDTSKLDAGTWTLHLTVELASGQAADVTHTLRVTP